MPGYKPITVAIIDDNRFVREALLAILGGFRHVRGVAAAVAHDLFLAQHNPDVLLLGAGLRDVHAPTVAAALRKSHPRLKVVVMDLLPADAEIADFINAGVSGFVLKDSSINDFVQAIQSVANGQKVLPRPVKESLCAHIAEEIHGRDNEPALGEVRMTRREQEVVGLIGVGLSNSDIAHWLNIATLTVKTHVQNVMEELALHTRLQIAVHFRSDRQAVSLSRRSGTRPAKTAAPRNRQAS